jgi:signal transduction histidine kinase
LRYPQSSAAPQQEFPRSPRGPRLVCRNRTQSLRFLAHDLAAAHQLINSLTVSESEAWARAEALGAATRDLLSLLSHELRTPLQAIFGYTELLEAGIHGKLNEDQRLDVSRIQESQKALLNLLNAVLQRVRTERLPAGRE